MVADLSVRVGQGLTVVQSQRMDTGIFNRDMKGNILYVYVHIYIIYIFQASYIYFFLLFNYLYNLLSNLSMSNYRVGLKS